LPKFTTFQVAVQASHLLGSLDGWSSIHSSTLDTRHALGAASAVLVNKGAHSEQSVAVVDAMQPLISFVNNKQ